MMIEAEQGQRAGSAVKQKGTGEGSRIQADEVRPEENRGAV